MCWVFSINADGKAKLKTAANFCPGIIFIWESHYRAVTIKRRRWKILTTFKEGKRMRWGEEVLSKDGRRRESARSDLFFIIFFLYLFCRPLSVLMTIFCLRINCQDFKDGWRWKLKVLFSEILCEVIYRICENTNEVWPRTPIRS